MEWSRGRVINYTRIFPPAGASPRSVLISLSPQSSQQEITTLCLPHGWWLLEAFSQTVAGPRTGSSKSKYQPLLGDPGLPWCVWPRHSSFRLGHRKQSPGHRLHVILPDLQELLSSCTTSFLAPHDCFGGFYPRGPCSLLCSGWRPGDLHREPSQPEVTLKNGSYLHLLTGQESSRSRGTEGWTSGHPPTQADGTWLSRNDLTRLWMWGYELRCEEIHSIYVLSDFKDLKLWSIFNDY